MEEAAQINELRNLLMQLCGGSRQDAPVVAKLRAVDADRLFAGLRELLEDSDPELRCRTALAIYYVDPKDGCEWLVRLLDDSEWIVRVEVCGLLHDLADKRAVHALIQRMKTDPNPMVRNTAAYALGGIADPVAIPSLIEALDNDHEPDELGHSTSGCAETALDNILRTNHTRIKCADGLCTMQPMRPDIGKLKMEAMELYRSL